MERNADGGHATREHGGNPQVSGRPGKLVLVVFVKLWWWRRRRQRGRRERWERSQDCPHPQRAPPLSGVAGGELEEDAHGCLRGRAQTGDATGCGSHASVDL